MTKASDNLFPGVIIRESANDGSDFSNPAADYRRLFLGEDGVLHVKDSSGTVTDPFSSGSGIAATILDTKGDLIAASAADTAAKFAAGANGSVIVADSAQTVGLKYIAVPVSGQVVGAGGGDLTNNTSGSWTDITSASITITTLARNVMLHFNGVVSNAGADAITSFQFLVDGSALTGTGSLGDMRSQEHTATVAQGISMSIRTPSALSAGSHTFKVQWRPSTNTSTLKNASASNVWSFSVHELWD